MSRLAKGSEDVGLTGVILDALLGREVGYPVKILVEDLAEHRLTGGGVHEQRDRRAQLHRVDSAEDLLRRAARQAGEDVGAFDQPCAEDRMCHVCLGLCQ